MSHHLILWNQSEEDESVEDIMGKINLKMPLIVVICVACYLMGYITSYRCFRPERTVLGGRVIKVSPKYEMTTWFHDDGSLREVQMTTDGEDSEFLHTIYYSTGITKSFIRKVPKGTVTEGFSDQGTPVIRDYRDDSVLVKREYLRPDGTIERSELF